MLEITVFAVHALVFNVLAALLVPRLGPAFLSPVANAWWGFVNGGSNATAAAAPPVPKVISEVIQVIPYVQLAIIPLIFVLAILYEGLFWWISVGRWRLDAR
ncbi:hypothetical protein HK100_005377, partial [Physocladia obscura]